jgi:hypothetical protein
MADLKPCPFCGKPVSMVYNSFDKAFKFYHKDFADEEWCRVVEPIMLRAVSLTDAAAIWNRRNGGTIDAVN